MPEIAARSRTRTTQPPKPIANGAAAKPSRAVTPFLKAEFGVTGRPLTTGRDTNESINTVARKQAMLDALSEFLGVVHYACQKAGVSRATHYWWMQHDENYANAVGALQDVALDFVEGQLLTNIRAGKELSTMFYLKTKGKKRGYVERTEITGADGAAINVNFTTEQVKEDLPIEALQAVLLRTVFKGAAMRPALPNPIAELPAP